MPLGGGGVITIPWSVNQEIMLNNDTITRRAAKMVCLDMDHPDIEAFINWKLTEEEKVAALVAGSQHLQNHANEILAAIQAHPEDESRFNQSKINPPFCFAPRSLFILLSGSTLMCSLQK